MAWFNTDWNIANMFNSPNIGVNFGQREPDWMNAGAVKTQLPAENPVWGAPAYYQEPNTNIFNNPYQTQGGGFFNPYQFGQVDYPYQSGGNNTNQQEQPWWMNYNTNNSIVNNSLTSNMPTSTQADPSIVPRPGGTGPGGKDLTHAETIKYFGLYDDAETAFAAGDKQSAYRKDHMHWRAGTGAWEGKGKKPGQSDLDYPGRTTADGNVILGDRQKLGAWSGMLSNWNQLGTKNDEGGTDYGVPDLQALQDAGITKIGDTEFEVKPADDPYWNRNNNIFDNENELRAANDILSSGDLRRFFGTEQIYPLDNSNAIFKEEGTVPLGYQGGIATDANLFRMFNADREKNQSLRKEQWDFQNHFGETDHWNLGRPGDSNYVPFVPTYKEPEPIIQSGEYNYFDPGDNIFQKTAADWAREYETDRVYQHKPAVNLDPFNEASNYNYQSASQIAAAEAEVAAIAAAEEERQRKIGLAEAAQIKAKEAAETRARIAAAEAAAEKARQAAAAQKRMNDEYDTGYVAPNIFTTSGPSTRGSRGNRTKPEPSNFRWGRKGW